MSDKHLMDVAVAQEVGAVPALVYEQILFWHKRAVANGKHCHDGRTWVYNSVKAWGKLFPYLSTDQLRRALDKLEAAGFIAVGSYNKTPYDRTKWYSPLRGVELAKTTNQGGENHQPIPEQNPEQNPEEESTPADAGPPPSEEAQPKPTATKYRWHGQVIRLNERDFDRWQQSFSSLDLPAELESLDAWLGSPDATDSHRKGWFHVVAGALKNRQAAEKAKRQTVSTAPPKPNGMHTSMRELWQ